ncbi:MAG: hypothetical protein ACREL5_08570 [Gemmatimonadales bacterium]
MVVGAVVVATACSTAISSAPATLEGAWGGQDIWAHDSGAAKAFVVKVACWSALFQAPIPVNDSAQFTAAGTVILASWSPLNGTPVHMSGRITRGELDVDLSIFNSPTGQWEEPRQYSLIANAPAKWRDNYCIQ